MSRRQELARGARDVARGSLGLLRKNPRVAVLLGAALVFARFVAEVGASRSSDLRFEPADMLG